MERIVVARTDPFSVPFDWLWMVRDASGVVVGFGTESGANYEQRCRERATACFELRFTEPLPEGFESFDKEKKT